MVKNNAFNEVITKYRENKLSHAYLIETNNLDQALLDLKEVLKVINCPNTYQESCSTCNLCHLIDTNNLPNLKIISPDGAYIKKNQIEELKQAFSAIPVYSRFNVYILNNAEKLNPSSANSMLKFLEEPTPGILGFFLTPNKDVMLDTIKSRCQFIVANYETSNILEKLGLNSEQFATYQHLAQVYLNNIYQSQSLNNKKQVLSLLSERKEIETLFKLIFEIYYAYYLKALNKPYAKDLTNIIPLNLNLTTINHNLQIITSILTKISYNVNMELILDEFIIEMRGTNG